MRRTGILTVIVTGLLAAPAAAQLPPLPTAVPTAVPTIPPIGEQPPEPQPYRSLLLEERLKPLIKGKRKTTLAETVNAMELGGSTDLRAHVDLPPALRIIGRPGDSSLRRAVDQLGAWQRAGGLRKDANHDGTYEHSDAIRLMDAWWPLWVRSQFQPALASR